VDQKFHVTLVGAVAFTKGGRKFEKNRTVVFYGEDAVKSFRNDDRFTVITEAERKQAEEGAKVPRRRPREREVEVRPPPREVDEDDDDDDVPVPLAPALPPSPVVGGPPLELIGLSFDDKKMSRPDLEKLAMKIGAHGPDKEPPATAPTKGILAKWIRERQTELAANAPKRVG